MQVCVVVKYRYKRRAGRKRQAEVSVGRQEVYRRAVVWCAE